MLYGYLNNAYFEADDVSISWAINASGKASFMAPVTHFSSPFGDFRSLEYSLYFQDRNIVTGVIETASPVIKGSGIDTIKFSGTTELGLLSRVSAKSNANYQNQPAIFIIDDLIRKTDEWRLGYAAGFDTAILTTVDLRKSRDLLSQLKELFKKLPGYNFRYGGQQDGYYLLDVGPLGDYSGVAFVQGTNLTDPIKKVPFGKRLLYEIEGFGGTAGGRDVYLKDASDGEPSLLTHPTYPIVLKADGTYVVRDLSASAGDSVLKFFSNIKPTNTSTPTAGEMQEAGKSVWYACVNELVQANTQYDRYEVEAVFGIDLIQQ